MMRKTTVPAPMLLIVILSMLVIACGSEAAQKEDDGRAGSAAEKNEQKAATGEGRSQQPGSAKGGEQLTNIGRPPDVVDNETSYVSPLTELFGDIFVGRENFIASSSVLRAAPNLRVELEDGSTVQDNVVVRAKEESVTIGAESNLGHHAVVRDSKIGDSAYIGYNTEISDSRVGSGARV